MKNKILEIIKTKLVNIGGGKISNKFLWNIEMMLNYLKLGKWMKENGYFTNDRCNSREEVFNCVINNIKEKKVLYLEFGVKYGDSIKYWSNKLNNPNSKLHGFDSFEGLPEDWDDVFYKKGSLSVGGKIPNILDKRVKFFKGWFNEVLPVYINENAKNFDDFEVIILMIDSDLYSSAKEVLENFAPYINEKFYIYFDNMSRVEHEPKAFKEFMENNKLKFELVCTDYCFNRSFFKYLEKKYNE